MDLLKLVSTQSSQYKRSNDNMSNIKGGCLVAGTKIQMADGSLKNVEEIQPMELVKTLNGNKKVIDVWTPDNLEDGTPECFEIEFEDGFKVVCSGSHKFIVNDEWTETNNLKVKDEVKTIDGMLKVTSIESVGKKDVYDINVKDVHHYALENGVITHNSETI